MGFLPTARGVIGLQRFIMHGGELPLYWVMHDVILEEVMPLMLA